MMRPSGSLETGIIVLAKIQRKLSHISCIIAYPNIIVYVALLLIFDAFPTYAHFKFMNKFKKFLAFKYKVLSCAI